MVVSYYNPVKTIFGEGALSQLPAVLRGRRAVLVTFREASGLGLTEPLIERCGGLIAGVIDQVDPNPDIVGLGHLYRAFWQRYRDCEVVVAMGGGSVLDTAKVLLTGTATGEFDELLALLASGVAFKPVRHKKLIAIPTTAGTGSEVTPWATVWDRTVHQKKYSLHLEETWPECAIVDPELTYSLPAAVTLQSGLDALSHALEAIWNVNANPISDVLAVAAAREMIAILPDLVAHPEDRRLRSRASLAALKAGMAFSNTKTALAHSISYDMTIRHGLPHGIACSFTLPLVLKLASGRIPSRDALLGQLFDCPLGDAPAFLQRFLEDLGVSTSFESYGVAAGESDTIIAEAMSGPRGRNFIGAAIV